MYKTAYLCKKRHIDVQNGIWNYPFTKISTWYLSLKKYSQNNHWQMWKNISLMSKIYLPTYYTNDIGDFM